MRNCRAECLTVVTVAVNFVVRDGEGVRVVVGVKPVLDVVVHLVASPHAPLVSVRVHAVVHAVDVGVLDVAIHLDLVKNFRVGKVFAEAADFPGEAVALGIEPAEVAHGGVDDVLDAVDWAEGDKKKERFSDVRKR